MNDIVFNILFQAFCFIICIYLAGFLIGLINRAFYGFFGGSRAVIYATGIIGTPVHETAHALMCILFGHKINEIKFFQIDEENGVLGYVRHSYNRRNLYAVLGNYFIGVAPILAGCAILNFSLYYLLPKTYVAIVVLSRAQGGAAVFENLGGVLSSFFSEVGNPKFWIVAAVDLCIALHMNLSGADIKGSLTALPLLILLLVLINAILGFAWSAGYAAVTGFLNAAGLNLIVLLVFSVMFSLLYLAIGFLISLIVRRR